MYLLPSMKNTLVSDAILHLCPIISLKDVSSTVTTVIFLDNGNIIDNPYHNSDKFNNYFTLIDKIPKKAKYSQKIFSD